MVTSSYCPNKGDLIWLEFTPQAGREQAGLRPAIVLSPKGYHSKTHLALVCPITSHIKGYPFEVILPDGLSISGCILADQIRNLDWKQRHAKFIAHAPTSVINETLEKLQVLLN